MTKFSLLPLTIALSLTVIAPVQAQSLLELYESARVYDATFKSAQSAYDASLARAEQARAGIYPSANLSAGASRSQLDSSLSSSSPTYGSQSVTLSAAQPLYRPANTATYEQGKKQAEIAQAQLTAAEQDLIVRVGQAYFDVLGAQDSLAFVKSQKAAVSEQLASAKRNFEVGTSTVTDSREAQARFDLVIAQEIAAENDLRIKKNALQQLVGKSTVEPKVLATPVALPALQPTEADAWAGLAEANHAGIKQAQLALDVARLETQKAQAGHKPTLDLTGNYAVTHNNGTSSSTAKSRSNVATVGLAFNLPLFAGFATQNRIKETLALEDKAMADLESTKRAVSQATRSTFFGVQSGMGQVKALEAAEASSQSALDANKLGYQVGVRINIDVLNSQSQLFQTKRDLSKARYDVLLGNLKLRQANGTLSPNDLQVINAMLVK